MLRWSQTEVEVEPIAALGNEAGTNKQRNRVFQTVLPVNSRRSVRIRPRAFSKKDIQVSNKKYIIRDPQSLNLTFYSGYDDNFIFNKTMSLLSIIDSGDEYKLLAEKMNLPPFKIDRKFFEALEAEIYFSEFHFFESFFGLMVAIFQDLPHWLYLTTYETKEIKEKVKAFLNEDIEMLTNGRLTTFNDFVNLAIYTDCNSSDEKIRQNWQLNIDNILWTLRKIGQKYLDAKEYNGYKHGLRVMTGPTSFVIYPDGEPNKASGIKSDHSLIFFRNAKQRWRRAYGIPNSQTL